MFTRSETRPFRSNANRWHTIRGPPGAAGNNGQRGFPGAPGSPGPTGPQGPTGPVGPIGATGRAGTTGPPGSTGGPGPAGPTGSPGATGIGGPTGPRGLTGPEGPTGPVGPTGATGPAGVTGATGDAGPPGISINQPYDALTLNASAPLTGATGYTVNPNGGFLIFNLTKLGGDISITDGGWVVNANPSVENWVVHIQHTATITGSTTGLYNVEYGMNPTNANVISPPFPGTYTLDYYVGPGDTSTRGYLRNLTWVLQISNPGAAAVIRLNITTFNPDATEGLLSNQINVYIQPAFLT